MPVLKIKREEHEEVNQLAKLSLLVSNKPEPKQVEPEPVFLTTALCQPFLYLFFVCHFSFLKMGLSKEWAFKLFNEAFQKIHMLRTVTLKILSQ